MNVMGGFYMKFIVGIVIAVAMVCGVYTTKSITESIDKTSNNTVSTQTDNNYNKRKRMIKMKFKVKKEILIWDNRTLPVPGSPI